MSSSFMKTDNYAIQGQNFCSIAPYHLALSFFFAIFYQNFNRFPSNFQYIHFPLSFCPWIRSLVPGKKVFEHPRNGNEDQVAHYYHCEECCYDHRKGETDPYKIVISQKPSKDHKKGEKNKKDEQ